MSSFNSLYRFLDLEVIEPPEVILPSEHHVLGNRIRMQESLRIRLNETWRETLAAGEIDRVMRIAGDLNASLGYV